MLFGRCGALAGAFVWGGGYSKRDFGFVSLQINEEMVINEHKTDSPHLSKACWPK